MNPINSIIFPAPVPTYTHQDFPNELCWIPRDFSFFKNDKVIGSNSIPAIMRMCETPSSLWMVMSHGNAYDIGSAYYEIQNFSNQFKANVIAYEYQGYGISEGCSSADSCVADHITVLKFMLEILKIPPKNIIVFGRSIGTGISSTAISSFESGTPNNFRALILQSAFTCIRDIAITLLPILGYLSPNPLSTIDIIHLIKCPIFFIHGELDTLIPSTHSVELFDRSPSTLKDLKLCPNADHNRWNNKQDIYKPIKAFLKTIEKDVAITPFNVEKTLPMKIFIAPPIEDNIHSLTEPGLFSSFSNIFEDLRLS